MPLKQDCIVATMNTAERILKLLKDAGVPERKIRRTLADLCGISYQAVKEWFDGSTRRISPEYLALIADAYGTTLEYLVSGTGTPNTEASRTTQKTQVDQEIDEFVKNYRELTRAGQLAVMSSLHHEMEKLQRLHKELAAK